MVAGSQTHRPIAQLKSADTSLITNLSLPLANTEVDHPLQSGLKQLSIKTRTTGAVLKYSFTDTESGTKYITIPTGCEKSYDLINFIGKSLHIQSPTAGAIVEIEELY